MLQNIIIFQGPTPSNPFPAHARETAQIRFSLSCQSTSVLWCKWTAYNTPRYRCHLPDHPSHSGANENTFTISLWGNFCYLLQNRSTSREIDPSVPLRQPSGSVCEKTEPWVCSLAPKRSKSVFGARLCIPAWSAHFNLPWTILKTGQRQVLF